MSRDAGGGLRRRTWHCPCKVCFHDRAPANSHRASPLDSLIILFLWYYASFFLSWVDFYKKYFFILNRLEIFLFVTTMHVPMYSEILVSCTQTSNSNVANFVLVFVPLIHHSRGWWRQFVYKIILRNCFFFFYESIYALSSRKKTLFYLPLVIQVHSLVRPSIRIMHDLK